MQEGWPTSMKLILKYKGPLVHDAWGGLLQVVLVSQQNLFHTLWCWVRQLRLSCQLLGFQHLKGPRGSHFLHFPLALKQGRSPVSCSSWWSEHRHISMLYHKHWPSTSGEALGDLMLPVNVSEFYSEILTATLSTCRRPHPRDVTITW